MAGGSSFPKPRRPIVAEWYASSIVRSSISLRAVRTFLKVSRRSFCACHSLSALFCSVSVSAVAGTMKYSPTSGGGSYGVSLNSRKAAGSSMYPEKPSSGYLGWSTLRRHSVMRWLSLFRVPKVGRPWMGRMGRRSAATASIEYLTILRNIALAMCDDKGHEVYCAPTLGGWGY